MEVCLVTEDGWFQTLYAPLLGVFASHPGRLQRNSIAKPKSPLQLQLSLLVFSSIPSQLYPLCSQLYSPLIHPYISLPVLHTSSWLWVGTGFFSQCWHIVWLECEHVATVFVSSYVKQNCSFWKILFAWSHPPPVVLTIFQSLILSRFFWLKEMLSYCLFISVYFHFLIRNWTSYIWDCSFILWINTPIFMQYMDFMDSEK